MGSFSDYLEDAILDHILNNGRGNAYTPPTDLYIALFTSVNGLENNTEGSQDEVSGGAYARYHLDGSTDYFDQASGGAAANHGDIAFAVATAAWGTITHVAIMDALTSGNVLIWGALTASKDIGENDQFKFLAGELEASLD